jgi:hypothetical protein
MLTATQATQQTTTTSKTYRPEYIFVVQLHDGTICVGQASNPSKRIAALNSGFSPAVPKPLMVNNIIGIKEQNEDRTYVSVVNKFIDKYGENRVLAI